MQSVLDQIRRHSVALISLVIALSSLGYNTWRNELTEANRNIRTAGIEHLLILGELDQVVFFSHYDMDDQRGSPRAGWALVLTARDLASLSTEPAVTSTNALHETWEANWQGLGTDDAAARRISDAIDKARTDMLAVLAALD